MDAQGRLWFGEARVNRIGMFDPQTEHFQEWVVPTPYSNPYDVMADKNGEEQQRQHHAKAGQD